MKKYLYLLAVSIFLLTFSCSGESSSAPVPAEPTVSSDSLPKTELVEAMRLFDNKKFADAYPLLLKHQNAPSFSPAHQYALGFCFSYGYGASKDEVQATKWFVKSAEGGYAEGQYALGMAYENGWGTPVNEAEAVKCFRAAAEQGNAHGQYALGLAYEKGKGGLKADKAEAIRLYKLSAASGDEYAIYALEQLVAR